MASLKRDSPSTIPVPSSTRRRLWYMVIGAAVFIIIAFIEGLLRPDYDAWQQSVSALSLGPRGVEEGTGIVEGESLLREAIGMERR